MIYINKLAVIILLLTLIEVNCSNPTSPVKENIIAVDLKLVDVSCTESFIDVSVSNALFPVNISVIRDDKNLFNFTLNKTDTIITDATLQPNKIYTYQTSININEQKYKSGTLQVNTLDTTSNNFSWSIFTFGEPNAGNGILYDVSIVDYSNIYAVGQFFMDDSTGEPDPIPYNLSHWDGTKWEFKKLTFQSYPSVIKSVFLINENDIWFDPQFHFDGHSFQEITLSPILNSLVVNKMWGNSFGLYVVGNSGFIATKNDNGDWIKIESGTMADIRDIWGGTDIVNNNRKVLVLSSSFSETEILSISANTIHDTLNWPINQGLDGIWFTGIETYVCGQQGIWKNANKTWHEETVGSGPYEKIKGNQYNNIFAVGGNNIIHFNGVRWEKIKGIPLEMNFVGLDVSNQMIVVSGLMLSSGGVGIAAIFMGKQINYNF